jgi:hypothetical protein
LTFRLLSVLRGQESLLPPPLPSAGGGCVRILSQANLHSTVWLFWDFSTYKIGRLIDTHIPFPARKSEGLANE